MKYLACVLAVCVVLCLAVGCLNVENRCVDRSVQVLRGPGCGSGVFVCDDLILTARHVTQTPHELRVRTPDGEEYPVIEVIQSADADLALMRVLTPARERRVWFGKARVGVTVYHVGSPHGLWPTVSRGIVSALRPEGGYVQTDAMIAPGSSGGGLFDSYGRLIGVVTARYEVGFSIAVDVERIRGFLNASGTGVRW